MEYFRSRASKEFRENILLEHTQNGVSISELARKYGINPATIYVWKRNTMSSNDTQSSVKELLSKLASLEKENKTLKRALGEKELDIQLLKDLTDFLKKKDLERKLSSPKNSYKKIKTTRKAGSANT
jgi:transposase-like protein